MPAPVAELSRWCRVRRALTPQEWRRALALAAAVLGLHVVGVFLLLVLVVPQDFRLGHGAVFGLGLGITAYTLGLRHAFDADHICVIDNTTRKLMADGQRPLSVGFFFSLGHSTIVFLLAFLFSVGVRGLSGSVESGSSTLRKATGVIGASVSGSFLILIGILNLVILVNIVKVFRRMRLDDYDEQALEHELNARGFMNRLYGRATRAVKKPWQMYPLGVLFGLGFDTATEVALLFLAAGAAGAGLPFYAILCLPILFAAGMSLLDTIDGAFMNFAYGWAFSKPVRKIYYNIIITGLSVAVALIVGTIELLSVLADRLSLHGGIWDFASNLDLNLVGYFIVGLFVITWGVALAVWRYAHIEERWSAHRSSHDPRSPANMTVAPRHPPLAVGDLEDAARAVRNAGGRLTAPRRAVLEALLAADHPVSAEQIADGLGGRLPATEQVSVYRNLDWLEEIGVVRHVHVGHGAGLYQLASVGEHEYLVCERCAAVTSIDAAQLSRVRAEIKKVAGFHAHFDHFPIHGLCPVCAVDTDAQNAPS